MNIHLANEESGSLHNSSTHPTERNVTAFANKVPKEAGRGCQPDGAKLLTSTPSRGERTLFPAQGAPLRAEERSWLLGKNQEAKLKGAQATHRKPNGKRGPSLPIPGHLSWTSPRTLVAQHPSQPLLTVPGYGLP